MNGPWGSRKVYGMSCSLNYCKTSVLLILEMVSWNKKREDLGNVSSALTSVIGMTRVCHTSRQCGLLDASRSRAEAVNVLRVRDCFENTTHTIDFLPRKMHVAKYMSKVCNNFRSFWISVTPTRGSGVWRTNPPPTLQPHLGSSA